VGAAQGVLNETASALGASTSPQLGTTWFSSTYWRMAAIAAVLTLPFLFAAAVQALMRSDLGLLARATFGYLPLAMLVIAIAAPLTTLLLAACDQLCSMISSAAGNESAHFLARASVDAAALTALAVAPFLTFLVGLFIIGAAFGLWIELLLREAAVYVIVLMLPLGFAAFVWPARRIWAIRAVELLVALILSKFAIVAVLSLGGAAISSSGDSVTGLMAGAVLIMLASFSPWALLRLIPMAELASGAAGPLRGELRSASEPLRTAARLAQAGDEWVSRITASMSRDAESGLDDIAPPSRVTASSGAGAESPGRGGRVAGEIPAGAGSGSGGAAGAGENAAATAVPMPDGAVPAGASSIPAGAGSAGTVPDGAGSSGTVPDGAGSAATTASSAPEPPSTSPSAPALPAAEPSATPPDAPAGHEPDEGPAPRAVADDWQSEPILVLGSEGFASTPVWPNTEAR
jgi:hypothetical protein